MPLVAKWKVATINGCPSSRDVDLSRTNLPPNDLWQSLDYEENQIEKFEKIGRDGLSDYQRLSEKYGNRGLK
ncbi:hypothetical protein C5167_011322 [Papaver somniferum]|uniref:Uncharacterized protein n=1 Tax=Papaver somniferum TaxID=3469 RepID=A0A4Y7K3Y4_PAPSO|nr:hypothetical protein C5167_011322 [Papaver somniferum]